MMSRLVELKDVLEGMTSTTAILPGGMGLDISSTDWLTLSQMVDVLKPFKETTKVLCALDASLGQVIPLVHALDRGLTSCLAEGHSLLPRSRALVLRLQDGIRNQLHPLCKDRVYQLSCLCDPRIKGSLAGSLAELQGLKAELSLEVCKVTGGQGRQALSGMRGHQVELREGSSQEGSLSRCANPRPSKPTYLASVIAWAVSSSAGERPSEEQESAEAMVMDYMSEPLQPPMADPLRYWASKAEIWPPLSSVAMDLLSIPPTSIQSEQVFSQLGDVLMPHCSCLDPGTVERLAFIRFNLSALRFPSLEP
ncbi:hypothetical protein JRQ81_012270 [Phrynocephalus forsythii]|uniref:HAT C-terminal dimerisation domain-containing protein n=1 Tax=Phrynocephalus forsythii TaxID=171643 RepID=A0A9Q1AQD9_9SAUR|nr:hypothetical protein JRQ81_012270 [Phrynocephalus forsythii]